MDDSDLDKDYVPSDAENSDVNEIRVNNLTVPHQQAVVVAAPETEASDENTVEGASPKRRKRPAVKKWKSSTIKEKRLKGEAFRNRKGKEREAKSIGQPCTSEYCRKSTLRSCQSLSDEQRRSIFARFWSMKTWEERRSYVHALVNTVDIKQKSSQASRRSSSRLYHLKLGDATSFPVCKSLFCSTLGLSKRTVASWLDVNNQNPPKPKTPKKGKCVPVGAYDLNFLKNWLNGLPTVPSHYCRNVPAYQSKKFLYPGATKANLHAEYTAAATEAKARVVGLKYFSNVFSEKKFSVFIPRTDQCDICVSAKHGNLNQAALDKHVKAKDEARAEKARDKAAASEKMSVWTMDMQAVLLCPDES